MARLIKCKFCGTGLNFESSTKQADDIYKQYVSCKGCHASFVFVLALEKINHPPVQEVLDITIRKMQDKTGQLDLLTF